MERGWWRGMRRKDYKGLEPDASLDEDDVHVVITEAQGRRAHLAVEARLEEDALVRLPLHAGADQALAVSEVLAGDGVAAIVPDVVLDVALQRDLVGHRPQRTDVAAGHQHEAGLDVLGRTDVARSARRNLELRGRGPGVDLAKRGVVIVARGELLVVAPHPFEAPVEARVAGQVPAGSGADRRLVALVLERPPEKWIRRERGAVRRAAVLEAGGSADEILLRRDVGEPGLGRFRLDVVDAPEHTAVLRLHGAEPRIRFPAWRRHPLRGELRAARGHQVLVARLDIRKARKALRLRVRRDSGEAVVRPVPRRARRVPGEIEALEVPMVVPVPGVGRLEALLAHRDAGGEAEGGALEPRPAVRRGTHPG